MKILSNETWERVIKKFGSERKFFDSIEIKKKDAENFLFQEGIKKFFVGRTCFSEVDLNILEKFDLDFNLDEFHLKKSCPRFRERNGYSIRYNKNISFEAFFSDMDFEKCSFRFFEQIKEILKVYVDSPLEEDIEIFSFPIILRVDKEDKQFILQIKKEYKKFYLKVSTIFYGPWVHFGKLPHTIFILS